MCGKKRTKRIGFVIVVKKLLYIVDYTGITIARLSRITWKHGKIGMNPS